MVTEMFLSKVGGVPTGLRTCQRHGEIFVSKVGGVPESARLVRIEPIAAPTVS